MTIALDVYNVLSDVLLSKHLYDRQKEHFWTVLLSSSNNITFIDEVSVGNLNSTLATPREIFRWAITKGASKIIVVHNHPSGSLIPSQADSKLVTELSKAGEIIGIEVLDALIITEKSYYSFKSQDKKKILKSPISP